MWDCATELGGGSAEKKMGGGEIVGPEDGKGKKEIAMAVLCRGREGVDEAG